MIELEFENNLECDLELTYYDGEEYSTIPYLEEPVDYQHFFRAHLFRNLPCLLGPWVTSSWPCLRDWVKEVQGGVKEEQGVSTEVKKAMGGTKEVKEDIIRDSKNELDEQGPATAVRCPDLSHILGLVGEEAAVPVSSCDRRFFNSQECGEERLGEYMEYWSNRQGGQEQESKYLKDWHFHRLTNHSYSAYSTPPFFCSDWLNEWWEEREDEEASSDYRFLYIGPRGSWTPLHSDVFGSYSWSANIVGRKRWLFYRPGQEVRDGKGELVWDVGEAGEDGRLELLQEAGQVVFVPSGWHHQVTNLEDTISINHNWFNGTNIMVVFNRLKEELGKVENEIRDCQGEGWRGVCQDLLRASYGMNMLDMFSLLSAILRRRVRSLEEPGFTVVFDGQVLGPNHARFDIRQIKAVLVKLAVVFGELEFVTQQDECENLLESCNKHL